MKKILIASLAGGLTAFLWGFISWSAIGLSHSYTHEFSNEDAILAAMADGADGPGYYIVPGVRDGAGEMRETEDWTARAEEGPYAQVYLQSDGFHFNPAVALPRGLLIEILASLLIVWIVTTGGPSWSFVQRWKPALAMGLFAGLTGPMVNWNFMNAPTDWSVFLVLDGLITWGLAGLVIAAVLKPADK